MGAGQLNQCQPVLRLLGPPSAQAATLGEPGDRPLDGLITKDKFCMRRRERLALSVSRREVYTTPTKLEEPAHSRAYPPYESTHHGGANETPVPRPPGSGGTPGRPAALGPGLPEPPSVEPRDRTKSSSSTEARGGGVPCG